VLSVQRKVITTKTVSIMLFLSVYLVEAHTNRSVAAAMFYTHVLMSRTFQLLQLNVGKRDMVQLSLLNDDSLKDFSVLAISEPYSWRAEGTNSRVVIPVCHQNWTKMMPTAVHDGRWPIRSMLWIRKDLEARQISVDSADITAAVLRLPDRSILIVSLYVPKANLTALQRILQLLQEVIELSSD
jgi:hypothetical protein